jgi:hypothetical protein
MAKKKTTVSYTGICEEIQSKYSNSPARKRLAEKCLEKAKEWLATADLTKDRKTIKKELTAYLKANVDCEEERNVYGSMLLLIVMGAVVSWLVQRLLDNMFP